MRNSLLILAAALAAACTGSHKEADQASEVSAAPAAAATPEAAATPGGLLVYVSNEDSRELSVLDETTDRLVATIEV